LLLAQHGEVVADRGGHLGGFELGCGPQPMAEIFARRATFLLPDLVGALPNLFRLVRLHVVLLAVARSLSRTRPRSASVHG
jgi:hypothetical protein